MTPDQTAAKAAAREAFEVGFEFRAFILSSHCYDGRDLTRFFMLDGMPKWVSELVSEYERATSLIGSKDAGVYAAKLLLLDAAAKHVQAALTAETEPQEQEEQT